MTVLKIVKTWIKVIKKSKNNSPFILVRKDDLYLIAKFIVILRKMK